MTSHLHTCRTDRSTGREGQREKGRSKIMKWLFRVNVLEGPDQCVYMCVCFNDDPALICPCVLGPGRHSNSQLPVPVTSHRQGAVKIS